MTFSAKHPDHFTIFGGIKYVFHWSFTSKLVNVCASMRTSKNAMGRFGGGWEYKLCAQMGHLRKNNTCLIIDLLVLSIRFTFLPKTIN